MLSSVQLSQLVNQVNHFLNREFLSVGFHDSDDFCVYFSQLQFVLALLVKASQFSYPSQDRERYHICPFFDFLGNCLEVHLIDFPIAIDFLALLQIQQGYLKAMLLLLPQLIDPMGRDDLEIGLEGVCLGAEGKARTDRQGDEPTKGPNHNYKFSMRREVGLGGQDNQWMILFLSIFQIFQHYKYILMIRALNLFRKNVYQFSYSKAMYEAWKSDPSAVHEHWDVVFSSPSKGGELSPEIERQKDLALSAYMFIRCYKQRGHELADLDPLHLVDFKEFGKKYVKQGMENELKKLKQAREKDLDVPFTFPNHPVFQKRIANFLAEKTTWTLREIIDRLQNIYSNKMGLEFMHITDPEVRCWIMKEFESLAVKPASKEDKYKILEELTKSETFNAFLVSKFTTTKRFGVEGLDTVISGMNTLVQQASKNGVEYIGIGMSHRGRLSVLANVLGKPFQKVFAEFQEIIDSEQWGNSGDLKYHLGASGEQEIEGRKIELSVMPNPSHLEVEGPLCMGHVRAIKDSLRNEEKSMAVILHGDAACAGQGIVYEALQMSGLNAYNINGVIHIVTNNQIGFTTTPAEARTGLYPTDVAKSTQCPIIHVNADEPEEVNKAIKFAVSYRMKYKKDIFIDIIGYRRFGHSETDQPSFTQPMMYQVIRQRPPVYKIYSDKLMKEGSVTEEQVKTLWDKYYTNLDNAYNETVNEKFEISKWRSTVFHSLIDYTQMGKLSYTGLDMGVLKKIGERITHIPKNFNVNPTIKKIYDQRRTNIETEGVVDFATAESLAFGSLLNEGFNIRFLGQDVERGTFSHRHGILVDQKNEDKYIPLHNLLHPYEKWRYQVENSFLSENAALGFEYGYSITSPNTLTLWEAQFGDFANGAQIYIDNYISSGEDKWKIETGLVVKLPHGMDGQGPEHSSARMERYLQMMGDSWLNIVKNGELVFDPKALRHNNMAVICCSTAHNHFHSLRRQLRRDYRKPLINCFNKKLLKMKDAFAPLSELTKNRFDSVIDDLTPGLDPKAVTKIVLLYGQAYYAALEKRTELGRKDVALVRCEQLAPLHYEKIVEAILRYPNANQIVWFQEEHRNAGAWRYVCPRLSIILETLKAQGRIRSDELQCVSRKTAASPAVGQKKKHEEEQAEILRKLFEK